MSVSIPSIPQHFRRTALPPPFMPLPLLFRLRAAARVLIRCPAVTRLVFQPCQTWFVWGALKSNWNVVTWLDRFSPDAHACVLLPPRLVPGVRPQLITLYIYCCPTRDELMSAVLTSQVSLLYSCFATPRGAKWLVFSSAAEIRRYFEGTCELQSIPALHFNATIIYKGSRDLPPLFRRVYSSFGTWFSHLPENSNEMQMRCCRGATWEKPQIYTITDGCGMYL